MTENDKKLEALLYSIEYSYLPKASKKVLIILISAKQPIPLNIISKQCDYSPAHASCILKRLEGQNLVKRNKLNSVNFYTYTSDCNKFLDMKESIEFYLKKFNYKKA